MATSISGRCRIVRLAAASLLVGALLPATAARAQEVRLAASGDTLQNGGLFVAGPSFDPTFQRFLNGQALSATVIPERSGIPSRLELAMETRPEGAPAELRLVLQRAADDGRPGEPLATTVVSTELFPREAPGPQAHTSVPVSGWPLLEEGARYAVTASILESDRDYVVWNESALTSSVPQRWTGTVQAGAEEPTWNGPDGWNRIGGIRIFARRPSRLTANGLVANTSPTRVFLTPSATLMALDPEEPLAGRTVDFAAGGGPLCSATTDANGEASCTGPAPLVGGAQALGNYQASFAGDSGFAPSSADGALVR